MPHTRIHSGAPWEPVVGYCRAVVAGPIIAVSGTTAVNEQGELVGEGDAYAQARQCLAIIVRALGEAGASVDDVIRTRMYVTNIEDWEAIGRAHQEVFGAAPPATAMVEVARLMDERMLVEIEADAVIAASG